MDGGIPSNLVHGTASCRDRVPHRRASDELQETALGGPRRCGPDGRQQKWTMDMAGSFASLPIVNMGLGIRHPLIVTLPNLPSHARRIVDPSKGDRASAFHLREPDGVTVIMLSRVDVFALTKEVGRAPQNVV